MEINTMSKTEIKVIEMSNIDMFEKELKKLYNMYEDMGYSIELNYNRTNQAYSVLLIAKKD